MAAPTASHLLLVEPEPGRLHSLSQMLESLGLIVTSVAGPPQAALLLSQIQPDGIMVGLHPANVREVRAWLAALGAHPAVTLLYAEHSALLDLAAAQPRAVLTALWPFSRSELALLLASLR